MAKFRTKSSSTGSPVENPKKTPPTAAPIRAETEPKRKVGRLSEDERKYILASAEGKSVEEIAEHLHRKPETVREELQKVGRAGLKVDPDERVAIRAELKASEKWKRLRQELGDDEVSYFEEEYVKLMAQFRQDVLASEETQIFDVIRFDVLKSRNMIERRRAREAISRLQRQQEALLKTVPDASKLKADDRDRLLQLDTDIRDAQAAESSRTTEYVKLQERQDALMKSLKSTRDQRVKEVSSGAQTVLGLLKQLQNDEFRKREGRQAELVRMASDKEYARLGAVHTYEDGAADRPILSPDTVGEE